MASVPPSGLSLAGKAVFGSLCAGTFGLGMWQTQRYFEKQVLIAQRDADLEAPPTLLDEETNANNNESSPLSFRRVKLQGQYLHTAEFLVGPRGPPPGALPDKPGSSAAGMSSAPQGYFVLTPFVPASAAVRQEHPVVIVNRGWVPRHLVVPDRRGRLPPPPTSLAQSSPSLLQWDRPVPAQGQTHLDVVVVPSQQEKPRFLVAEHKMKERPPQLFWYDLETMQRWVAGYNNNNNNNKPLQLYTAVAAPTNTTTTWPAAPPAHAVGKFKVEPAVHAGYAATWFGLSAAGLYMTRKLLTRGR